MSQEKAGRTLECLSENSYSIKTVRSPNFTQGVVGGCREDLAEICQVPGMSRFDRCPLLLLKSNTSIPHLIPTCPRVVVWQESKEMSKSRSH